MKYRTTCAASIALLLGITAESMAATTGQRESTPLSAGVNVSTLGLGAQVSGLLSPHAALRLGFNSYDYTKNGTSGSFDYDGKLQLRNTMVAADLYPSTKSTFHWSVGLVFDDNKVTGHGNPNGASYTVNGNSYPSATVGTLNMNIGYSNSTAPYIGFGWGKPMAKGRFQVFTDFGAMFMGSSNASLTSSNPNVVSDLNGITPGLGTQYQNDVAAQQKKLQDDSNKLRVYPVVTIGASLSF